MLPTLPCRTDSSLITHSLDVQHQVHSWIYKICKEAGELHCDSSLPFCTLIFSLQVNGWGRAMPHCQEVALARVLGSSIIAGVLWCSLRLMLPVSQLISPQSPHHHPNTLPCELFLQCKVTDAIPHAKTKILVLTQWVDSTCENLWKSIVSLTPHSLGPTTLISVRWTF